VVWDGFDGTGFEIFLYNGTGTIQLSKNSTYNRNPQINANGDVVWVGYDSTDSEIFLYDGTGTTQLTNNSGEDWGAQINANGYVVWSGDYEILLYDGSGTTQLTNNSDYDMYPQINANGYVAYCGSTGINVDIFLATPANFTPKGTGVVVQPGDSSTGKNPVTITYDNVKDPGTTSLTTSTKGPPPPAGFKVGSPPVYYNITTTATYSGSIKVCVKYDPSQFSVPEKNLRIKQLQDTDNDGIPETWVDVTCPSTSTVPNPDTVSHIICACVNHLSYFAVGFEEREFKIDIKPRTCPNVLDLVSDGELQVAVVGIDEFDVFMIDPNTLGLSREGVIDEYGKPIFIGPLWYAYEDVATPFEGEPCDCHTLGEDGYEDLTLNFGTPELVEKLKLTEVDEQTVILTLTGNLWEDLDGIAIRGEDCMWILRDQGPQE
jgi:hypothetical protein